MLIQTLVELVQAYVEKLVNEAYLNWHSLEEVEGGLNGTPLLTQGSWLASYIISSCLDIIILFRKSLNVVSVMSISIISTVKLTNMIKNTW